VGCGTGEFLYYLRKRGFQNAQGVDLSEEELDVARALGADNVFQEDALSFLEKAPSSSLGLISAFNFFEHLTKAEILDLLAQIHRVLRPGGLLFAVTPNGLSPFSGATRYWDFSHETGFTPSSWRQLARLAGFSEASFEEYGPLPHSTAGKLRALLWQGIKLGVLAISYIEVGGPRDVSRVYTADMKIVLRR
jgi:SAM-dependent methyltransferase